MILTGKTEVNGENLSSANMSITNPKWFGAGGKPGLRGDRLTANPEP
jgi:hypothetical protein